MNNQFSENLKKIRKENNLSQEQLADELGVSRQAISKWESGAAYPEMDKIIALCNKFNVNIDDLLHKDIKETKGEEESKKKINNFIDDFLKYITDTINLFSNMNFKSKIKCLFEQVIIALILFLASVVVFGVIDNLIEILIQFLPGTLYRFVLHLLDSILIIGLLVVAIIIMAHIFKTRYLDYYEKIKEDSKKEEINTENNAEEKEAKNKEVDKNNKILYKKNEDKIVIRDPQHSEYKFINALFKFIILIIKFFVFICIGIPLICCLVALLFAFVVSFTISKTGLFFVGVITSIAAVTIITIVILLLIINFIFNRKNDKKRMIWSFILSLVVLGAGCGMIFIGTTSFDVLETNETVLQTVTKEYEMKENTIITSHGNYSIEYIEADNDNIKIEYELNKYCEVVDSTDIIESNNMISAWSRCKNPMEIYRELLKNVNDKKIIPMTAEIEKMTVYTNKKNIDKLNKNFEENQRKQDEENAIRNSYAEELEELEETNDRLNDRIRELEDRLSLYEVDE